MSLDQAIKHGKEKRKQYHGAKACDAWCRNHGYCWICRRNRLHKRIVELLLAKDKEEEEWAIGSQEVRNGMNVILNRFTSITDGSEKEEEE